MSRLRLSRQALRFLAGSPVSRRGRSRLLGAVIAVAVSLVPLVVVQQVADGMIRGIVERFIETGSYHLQAVSRHGLRGSASAWDEEQIQRHIARIRNISGVTTAVAERQGYGLVYSERGRSGVTLRAVAQDYWSEDVGVRAFMEEVAGSFDLTGNEGIVLGTEIASRLGAVPGDEVRVLTVRPLGDGRMLPRVSRFTVRGVVSTGYRDLDRLWSFIPRERGLRIIPDETAREIIGVKVEAPFSLNNPLFQRGLDGVAPNQDRHRMEAAFGEVVRELGPAWGVHSWYSAERSRYVSFLTSRNLLAFVMALIVAVAAVNISSALVLLVMEKEDEIAILRATGTSRRQIAGVFLLGGAVVGVVGASLGLALGVALALNINAVLSGIERVSAVFAGRDVQLFSAEFYLERVPVEIALTPLVGAVLLALVLSVGAAVIPARRAATVMPDRILRRQA